ncbi:MAG TPA: cation:dicarboxylase symporter family transporter [bacterium]
MALGIALTYLPTSRSQPVVNFLDGLNEAIIKLVHLIMKVAPYGVFALMAAVARRFGYSILITLIKYALVVLIGLAIHLGVAYSLLVRTLGGMSPLHLESIALILGVDRILDMCRTVVNMTGDATCAVFIARTEKKYKSVTAVS